jgi:pimeloyl-ACP methyl ester carboxylesterase
VPEAGYNPRVFADDLAALIRHLSLGSVVAVGHSLGGAIVAALEVEHPSLVRAVVEVDPAYGYDGPRAAAVRAALPRHTGPDCVEYAAATLSSLDGPNTPRPLNTWHRRRAQTMQSHVVAETQRGLWKSPDQFGFRPASDSYLARRQCPALTFSLSEKWGNWEAALLSDPHSPLVVWADCGHWLHQERADDFNNLVLNWIARLPR